jgi:hypothetical protein
MIESTTSRQSTYQTMMRVGFGVMQVIAFGVALLVVATDFGKPAEWPMVMALGAVLGQCSLAAAFAVFAPWGFIARMVWSALVVVTGGALIVFADAPQWRFDEAF